MNRQLRSISRSPHLNIMANAAFKAARGLVRDFGEVEHLQVSRKGPGDFVSTADKRAEDSLYADLKKAYPAYNFLLEERGKIAGNSEYTWIVDPLDGTTNFLHAIPHFAISIGLQKGEELVAGVVYDPIKDELFYAEKGGGAFLNDRRLRVSSRKDLPDALLGTGIPLPHHTPEEYRDFQTALGRTMPIVAGVRRLGAAALDLAYVAAGRFEGYWENLIAPWDVAAGIVLVREAGGYVYDLSGNAPDLTKSGSILATNQALHQPLKELLISSS